MIVCQRMESKKHIWKAIIENGFSRPKRQFYPDIENDSPVWRKLKFLPLVFLAPVIDLRQLRMGVIKGELGFKGGDGVVDKLASAILTNRW